MFAAGIIFTGQELLAGAAPLNDHRSVTFLARGLRLSSFGVCLFVFAPGSRVFAVRITGTGKEWAEFSCLYDHGFATVLTHTLLLAEISSRL